MSFAHPGQIELVAEVCHSFVLDNGAFSLWKTGTTVDFAGYANFVRAWSTHPGFDWALIPDVIDGTEEANDLLLAEWPLGALGVPVWHLHESLERLVRLAQQWPRIAFGSSGQFATPNTKVWWGRMAEAMAVVCVDGRPITRLHGLRMLNPAVFGKLPLASADSTNVARNIGIDKNWANSVYPPPTKAARGVLLATRIEAHQSAALWAEGTP